MGDGSFNIKYPEDFPSFEDVMVKYSEQNPEYKNLFGKRVRDLIRSIFLDEHGEALPDNQINRNRELTRVRVYFILKQLEQSSRWQQELKTKGPEAKSVAASDADFEASPRTFLKTVREILSKPTERLVVNRDDKAIEDEDLVDIIIDPERLTPRLLENLGLEKYIPPKGKRLSPAARLAHMAGAIPEIKDLLQSLEPLVLPYNWHESAAKYFRLMKIGAGKNKGKILGTQGVNGRKIFFKTDIYGAFRRIKHIMCESYREEMRLLSRIQAVTRSVHKKLGNNWPMSPEEIQKTREALLECVDSLKHVSNQHKQLMYRRIANSVSFKSERIIPAKYKVMPDGTEKLVREEVVITAFNPGAKRAVLVTIPKLIEKRKKDIRNISQFLARDFVISDDYISLQQEPFELFYSSVEELYPRFRIFNLDMPLSDEDREKIRRNLLNLRGQCSTEDSSIYSAPFLEPYLSFAEKTVGHVDSTISALDNESDENDREKTASEFMKIYLVAKIQHFYIQLMKFYEKFLSPNDLPNFSDVKDELEALGLLISEKRITATKVENFQKTEIVLKTPEYDDLYHYLQDFVSELYGLADSAMQAIADGNKDEAKIMKKELKDMINKLNIDQRIRQVGAAESEKDNNDPGADDDTGDDDGSGDDTDTIPPTTERSPV